MWLIDVRDGALTTLLEDAEARPYAVGFAESEDIAVLHYTQVDVSVAFDGTEVARSEPVIDCRQLDDAVEIAGLRYENVLCGPISPDGRRMTYRVVISELRLWDQWVIDLVTDERRVLQEGLRHCGGCGGRFSPGWSPSGRGFRSNAWTQELKV